MKILGTESVKAFETVDVRLTYEEVDALQAVLGNIGGANKTTRRRHTDSVNGGLREVLPRPFGKRDKDIRGTLYFLSREK